MLSIIYKWFPIAADTQLSFAFEENCPDCCSTKNQVDDLDEKVDKIERKMDELKQLMEQYINNTGNKI